MFAPRCFKNQNQPSKQPCSFPAVYWSSSACRVLAPPPLCFLWPHYFKLRPCLIWASRTWPYICQTENRKSSARKAHLSGLCRRAGRPPLLRSRSRRSDPSSRSSGWRRSEPLRAKRETVAVRDLPTRGFLKSYASSKGRVFFLHHHSKVK